MRRAAYQRLILSMEAAVLGLAGAWAVAMPGGFFRLLGTDVPRSIGMWSGVGIVALTAAGLLAHAAIRPSRTRSIARLVLGAQVFGALLWGYAVASGDVPFRTFPAVTFLSLAWWVPLGLVVFENSPGVARLRDAVPWIAAVIHVLAALAMVLVLRHGFEGSSAERADFILGHALLWRAGWGFWMVGAVSLIAFYAWWGTHLATDRAGLAAVAIASAGAVFDLFSEALFISWLPMRLEEISRLGAWLTTVLANGLYCVAGAVLTLASPMPPWLKGWSWAVWIAGFAMVVGGLTWNETVIKVTTAVLTVLLCPWFVAMGKWTRTRAN